MGDKDKRLLLVVTGLGLIVGGHKLIDAELGSSVLPTSSAESYSRSRFANSDNSSSWLRA
jgi:hypothetical protein